jgi:MFS family permease
MSSFIAKLRRRATGFLKRQSKNFKIMLIRRSLHAVAVNLSGQYNSIYATMLGANRLQLGSLYSAGNAIGAFIALPTGWVIDHYSLKKVFLIGTVLIMVSCSLYLIAPNWMYLYAAIVLLIIGSRITCTACTVTCANALLNKERATGRGVCRTLSSLATILTPMGAAWLVAVSGGISISGFRPLYALQLAIFLLIFVILVLFFKEHAVVRKRPEFQHVIREFIDIFRQGPDAIRIMFMIALMELPWSMAQPFLPLFAHQFKGADEFVLGGIAVARALAPLIFSIPLGRLADRYGRKRLLFTIAPLAYLANLFLIFANNRWMLLLSGLFFGFNSISIALASAMAAEIMPKKQMGKWIGVVTLIRGLMSIPAPVIGGLIWDYFGPHYVFIAVILLDVFLRLPLLGFIRETLHLKEISEECCQ